jgi:predicted DNA-binding transcriptional regulator AlpA
MSTRKTATAVVVIRLGTAEVARRVGRSACTLWRWYTAEPPRFPRPHFIGDRRAWFEHEVSAWEAEQMARPATDRRSTRNLTNQPGVGQP